MFSTVTVAVIYGAPAPDAGRPERGIFHDLANGFQSVFTHGLHQAATAIAIVASAPKTAAHATIRARFFSSLSKLRPAVVEVNDPSEEASESSFHPALKLGVGVSVLFPTLFCLSKINAASS